MAGDNKTREIGAAAGQVLDINLRDITNTVLIHLARLYIVPLKKFT